MKVYHYTDVHGLKGILSTQSFFASHYSFLNDPNETKTGKEKFEEFLHRICDLPHVKVLFKDEDVDAAKIEKVKSFSNWIWEYFTHEEGMYSVSFAKSMNYETAQNGLMSLWNLYGRDGGYALELDINGLSKCVDQHLVRYNHICGQLEDVGYGDIEWNVDDRERAVGFLSFYAQGIMRQHNLDEMLPTILKAVAFNKPSSYREEHEMRLALIPASQEDPLLRPGQALTQKKFRTKGGALLPYISIFDEVEKLPVTKIIVGPHPNQKNRMKGLKLFLESKGLSDIELACSQIEFQRLF